VLLFDENKLLEDFERTLSNRMIGILQVYEQNMILEYDPFMAKHMIRIEFNAIYGAHPGKSDFPDPVKITRRHYAHVLNKKWDDTISDVERFEGNQL